MLNQSSNSEQLPSAPIPHSAPVPLPLPSYLNFGAPNTNPTYATACSCTNATATCAPIAPLKPLKPLPNKNRNSVNVYHMNNMNNMNINNNPPHHRHHSHNQYSNNNNPMNPSHHSHSNNPFVPSFPMNNNNNSSKNQQHKLSKRIHQLNEMRAKKQKRKNRKVIHKQKINTNVISIELGTLAQSTSNIATGDPIKCNNNKCNAILSKYDTLLTETDDIKLNDDEKIWIIIICIALTKTCYNFVTPSTAISCNIFDVIFGGSNHVVLI